LIAFTESTLPSGQIFEEAFQWSETLTLGNSGFDTVNKHPGREAQFVGATLSYIHKECGLVGSSPVLTCAVDHRLNNLICKRLNFPIAGYQPARRNGKRYASQISRKYQGKTKHSGDTVFRRHFKGMIPVEVGVDAHKLSDIEDPEKALPMVLGTVDGQDKQ